MSPDSLVFSMRQQLFDGNHPCVLNLAREIEESPSSISSCATMSHTMASSRDVVCRARPSSSLDQPNAGMRPSESTVESQLSLQKVAGTVSPVSSLRCACLVHFPSLMAQVAQSVEKHTVGRRCSHMMSLFGL